MKNDIRIINKTGAPADTKIFINGAQLSLDTVLSVDIKIDHDTSALYLTLVPDFIDVKTSKRLIGTSKIDVYKSSPTTNLPPPRKTRRIK